MFADNDDDTKTHHPTRSRDPNASQPFFPRRKRANSGAPRWCMAAKPTVEMSRVGRWPGRCSGRMAAMLDKRTGVRAPMNAHHGKARHNSDTTAVICILASQCHRSPHFLSQMKTNISQRQENYYLVFMNPLHLNFSLTRIESP